MAQPSPGRRPLRAVSPQETSGEVNAPVATAPAPPMDPRPSLFAVLWRRLPLVLAAAAVCAGLTYAVASTQAPTYAASGSLFLIDPNRDYGLDPGRAPWVDPLRFTRARAALAESGPVFVRVAESLGTTPEAVRKRVKVLPSRETELVTISATASSPEAAERLVKLVQGAYEAVTASAQEAPYRRAAAELGRARAEIVADVRRVARQLAAAPGDPGLTAQQDLLRERDEFLRQRQATLVANAELVGSGVMLAERPVASDRPVSPRPLRSAMLGALLGGAAALGFFWFRANRSPKATPELAELVLGAPLLAEYDAPRRRRTRHADDAAHRVAYAAAALAPDAHVLVITAARDTERLPMLTSGIAAAAASAGRTVVLVDAAADRTLTARLGAEAAPGLADVTEATRIPNLIQEHKFELQPQVAFVPAGLTRSGPLDPVPYHRTVTELAKRFDLVLVDAPPVADLPPSPGPTGTTAAVFVVSPGTGVPELADARRRVELVGARVLGFVFDHKQRSRRNRGAVRRKIARRAGRAQGGAWKARH